MQLIINNKIINGRLEDILNKAKLESHKSILKDMKESGDYLMVSCPVHKSGKESHPSCGVMKSKKHSSIPFGFYHCFTCNDAGNLPKLISIILDISYKDAENWLVDNFGGDNYNIENELPEIILNNNNNNKYLNESILTMYDFYHPYMWERKLTKEITDKFRVGFDKFRNALTFPVWDINNKLKMITARSVSTKKFYIDKNIDKPVYLLNTIVKENHTIAMITEAQIDALTSWSYGFPCCATIGSISYNQLKDLNKSGVRVFITAFDNDEAGEKFTKKFNENIKDDILIYKFEFPQGKKDLNDLTKEEFWEGLNKLGFYQKENV